MTKKVEIIVKARVNCETDDDIRQVKAFTLGQILQVIAVDGKDVKITVKAEGEK